MFLQVMKIEKEREDSVNCALEERCACYAWSLQVV